jgi:hypothetical protein
MEHGDVCLCYLCSSQFSRTQVAGNIVLVCCMVAMDRDSVTLLRLMYPVSLVQDAKQMSCGYLDPMTFFCLQLIPSLFDCLRHLL